MLYWSLMFLFVALTVGLLVIAFTAAGARKILTGALIHTLAGTRRLIFQRWFRRLRVRALAGSENP